MVKLMNSAVMPQEGSYVLDRITEAEFVRELAQAGPVFESYVGYEQTAQHIEQICREKGHYVRVDVSRAQTKVQHGDCMLICKLRYRVADPSTKGQPQPEDWEYFRCVYFRPVSGGKENAI